MIEIMDCEPKDGFQRMQLMKNDLWVNMLTPGRFQPFGAPGLLKGNGYELANIALLRYS